jgi:hypothetical protein
MESNIPRVNGKMLPRVTYFPDSFHEINGAAYKPELRCLCQTPPFTILVCGEVQMLQLKRSRLAVRLESDLHFYPFFFSL